MTTLAPTRHARREYHGSCLLNIKAVTALYDHVALSLRGAGSYGLRLVADKL